MIRSIPWLLVASITLAACGSAETDTEYAPEAGAAIEEAAVVEEPEAELAEADLAEAEAEDAAAEEAVEETASEDSSDDADEAEGEMDSESDEAADGETKTVADDTAADETAMVFSNMKGKELPNVNKGVIEASDPATIAFGAGEPVFLDFFGWWCGTCNAMAPSIELTKANYEGAVTYFHVDVDDPANTALLEQFGVAGTPTFVLLDADGEVVQQWSGSTDVAEIDAAMAELTAEAF